MSEVTLNPYFSCNGNALEMMEYYHKILEGELHTTKFSETEMKVPDDKKDRLVHAELTCPGFSIMAADAPDDRAITKGDNVSLSLQGTDADTLTKVFNELAHDGQITMPLAVQFWGDKFGMLTDKFSTHWMVNIRKAEK
jgi:PhnB protein